MSVDGVLTFARRWAVVGILGSSILWISWFVYLNLEAYKNDYDTARIVYCADHLAFYTGAQLSRFGAEDRMYDHVFVTTYQNQLFWKDPADAKNDTWTWLEAFRNPPFYAVLYWPTCGWPYCVSALFWCGVSFLLTAIGTYWLTDDDRFGRRFLWVLSFLPTFAAFDYGQNTPISYFLFAAVFVLLAKDRPFLAGVVAGLLLYKPQLLLGLGVWALLDWKKKWPCVCGVVITGCLLAILSYMVLPTATKGFLDSFNRNLKFDSFEQFKMHNPLALSRLLLPADKIARELHGEQPSGDEQSHRNEPYYKTERTVRFMHNVFACVCGLAAIGVFRRLYRQRRNDVNVMFGGAVFLTLWANPHTLIYEWMLLALTGLLWFREWKGRPNTWFALYACAWSVLYFSTDLNGWILSFSPVTVQWSVPVLAVVGWYAVKLLSKPSEAVSAT